MMSLEQSIAQYEQFANVCEHHGLTASQEEFEQYAAWLRELQERRKAPEIIYCHECVKHNQSYGDNGTIDSCPLVLYRGKAQGHEFDYQFCAYGKRAERRTDGT